MQTVLLVIQLLLAASLIAVVMVQRTAQDGGGLTGGGGGGTMGGLFTARGSANLLTRTTAILATLFLCNSLLLAYLASSQHRDRNALDDVAPVTEQGAPSAPPAVPAVPEIPEVPLAK